MTLSSATAAEIVTALSELNTGSDLLRAALAVQLQIAPVDLRALFIVAAAPDITPSELGHRLSLTTGSVTALADRLQTKGFLTRARHATDRRSVVLHLTPAGDHAQQWASGPYARAAAEQLAGDGPSAELLLSFLTGLTAAFVSVAADVSAS